jgi:plastocyanin
MKVSEKKYLSATAIFIAVVFNLMYTGVAIGAGERQTHILEIKNLQFIPAEITVNIGDTIKWINHDIIPHTATADDKSWDSMLIDPGQEWELIVERNTFSSYFCVYHPGMKATIRINQ